MEFRRKILKYAYPLMIKWSKFSGKWRQIETAHVRPHQSFYRLKATDNQGREMLFSAFEGKKILIVNTASFCVFTDQYSFLQRLYAEAEGKLIILGFPSGDFREQEYADNKSIGELCALYDIRFPVMEKTGVRKNSQQHEVFRWLTSSAENGWNDKEPVWNFTKYLIDEMGDLIAVFGPSVEPDEIKQYL